MRSRIHAECTLEALQKAFQKPCKMRSRSLAGSASGALQNALQKQCRMRSRSSAECAPKALLNTCKKPCRIRSKSLGRMRSRSHAECAPKAMQNATQKPIEGHAIASMAIAPQYHTRVHPHPHTSMGCDDCCFAKVDWANHTFFVKKKETNLDYFPIYLGMLHLV